jgi:hypothetical protein
MLKSLYFDSPDDFAQCVASLQYYSVKFNVEFSEKKYIVTLL